MCAMCGCSSEAFMGVEMPNQNVYDVGPGQLNSPVMFGTDSLNPLGSSQEFRGSNVESEDDSMEIETED
jgi:hypothetical protein